jgi:hypothetical protein
MQLNVYRMILKLKYGMEINELALVILHPINDNWRVVKVNIMEEEVLDMFECRKRALKVKGNDGTKPIVLFEDKVPVVPDDDDDDDEMDNTKKAKIWVGDD